MKIGKVFLNEKLVFLILFLYCFSDANSRTINKNEIQVSLFGQSCTLSGPFDAITLQDIHSISPEQIFPLISLQKTFQVQKKIQNIKTVPTQLQNYFDKIKFQINAWVLFFQAIDQIKSKRVKKPYFSSLSNFLQKKNLDNLEQLGKELATRPNNFSTLDQLSATFESILGPNPQSEFHTAIRNMQTQYHCSFPDDNEEQQ